MNSLKWRTRGKARAILRIDHMIPTAQVKSTLTHLTGILDCRINYVNGTVTVDYDPKKTTIEKIRNLVRR
ncbi:MAG: heavy-metal-associated domain-containing protein [Nitrososphaerales archaeon]